MRHTHTHRELNSFKERDRQGITEEKHRKTREAQIDADEFSARKNLNVSSTAESSVYIWIPVFRFWSTAFEFRKAKKQIELSSFFFASTSLFPSIQPALVESAGQKH